MRALQTCTILGEKAFIKPPKKWLSKLTKQTKDTEVVKGPVLGELDHQALNSSSILLEEEEQPSCQNISNV